MSADNPSEGSVKSSPRQAPAQQVVSGRAQSEGANIGASEAGGMPVREEYVRGGGTLSRKVWMPSDSDHERRPPAQRKEKLDGDIAGKRDSLTGWKCTNCRLVKPMTNEMTMRQEACTVCLTYMEPLLESRHPIEGSDKRSVNLEPWQPLRILDPFGEERMFIRRYGWNINHWKHLGDDDILNVSYRTAMRVMTDTRTSMKITPEMVMYVARQVAMHYDATKLHAALGGSHTRRSAAKDNLARN